MQRRYENRMVHWQGKRAICQQKAIQGHYVEMVALAEQWRDAEMQKLENDVSYFENQLRAYAENNLPEGKICKPD